MTELTEIAAASIRYNITTLFANELQAGDVIDFPPTIAGEPIPGVHPLVVVVAVGVSADMYLDDPEPTTLITENVDGWQLIDHVPPTRRFSVVRPTFSTARLVAHDTAGCNCADCAD